MQVCQAKYVVGRQADGSERASDASCRPSLQANWATRLQTGLPDKLSWERPGPGLVPAKEVVAR